MNETKIDITDATTASSLDATFHKIWSLEKKTILRIDTTRCNVISVKKFLSLKSVLEKHRDQCRVYAVKSIIVVGKNWYRNVINAGLCVIKPPSPVEIVVKRRVVVR